MARRLPSPTAPYPCRNARCRSPRWRWRSIGKSFPRFLLPPARPTCTRLSKRHPAPPVALSVQESSVSVPRSSVAILTPAVAPHMPRGRESSEFCNDSVGPPGILAFSPPFSIGTLIPAALGAAAEVFTHPCVQTSKEKSFMNAKQQKVVQRFNQVQVFLDANPAVIDPSSVAPQREVLAGVIAQIGTYAQRQAAKGVETVQAHTVASLRDSLRDSF